MDKTYDFRVSAQPIFLFETPIACAELRGGDTLLQDLEQIIRARKESHPGIQRSNIGSWHSDTDMLNWGGPAASRLADSAVSVAKRMTTFKQAQLDDYHWRVRMWANVTAAGGLNHMHVHPGNLWAAVLYVDMGDDPESQADVGGRFYVEDPRFPMNTMHHTALRLVGTDGKPQELQPEFRLRRGNLVVFPAWLRHGVRQYNGGRERISIAMNIDAVFK